MTNPHPVRTGAFALTAIVTLSLCSTTLVAQTASAQGVSPTQQTTSFTDVGTSTWTVPPAITSVDVVVAGGQGGREIGGHLGGGGGTTTATLAVTPGAVLQVNVGGAGAYSAGGSCYIQGGGVNGGGAAYAAAGTGGGSSDIRSGSYSLDDRIVVAGGGGGAGSSGSTGFGGGGSGGNPASAGGTPPYGGYGQAGDGGGAGTQTDGGAAGTTYVSDYHQDATAGSKGAGGNGGCYTYSPAGGGGGGGWFGGGGGGGAMQSGGSTSGGGGGGGGSSYGPDGSTFGLGNHGGNGSVVIRYTPAQVGPAVRLVLSPDAATLSPGFGQNYTAHAFDVYNEDLGDVTADTTFTIAGGTCEANTCSAAPAGDHTVTATYGEVVQTAVQTTRGASVLTLTGVPSSTVPGAVSQVTVTATDSEGVVATNDSSALTFTSTDANADLPTAVSLVEGVATVPVSFNNAGSQTLTVTQDGGLTTTSDPIAVAGAVHLVVTGYPTSTTAGATHDVSVTATDADGSTVPDFAGSIVFTSSDGQAVLPQRSTLTNGTATFAVALKTAGYQTITASGYRNDALTGSETEIAVAAGPVTHLVVTGLPSYGTVGALSSVTGQGADAYGNLVSTYAGTAAVTSSDSKAVLGAATAADGGIAVLNVSIRSSGPQTVTVTDTVDPSITGSTSAYFQAGAATGITANSADSTVAGTALQVAVTPVDVFGNSTTFQSSPFGGGECVPFCGGMMCPPFCGGMFCIPFCGYGGYGNTLSVSTTDAQSPYFTDTFPYNFGTRYITVPLKTAGSQTITANLQGYTARKTVTVTPGAASMLTLTGYPATSTAGDSNPVTVQEKDAYGNVATQSQDALSFRSTDAKAVLPRGVLVDGTFTGPASLRGAGVQSITVISRDLEAMATLGDLTVSPAAATQLSLGQYPTGSVAGDGIHSLPVTVTDAFGNAEPDYSTTLTVTTTDHQAILPVPVEVTNGKGTVPIALRTSGSQTISVRTVGLLPLTGSSTTAIAPAAPSNFVVKVTGKPSIGATLLVTFDAHDRFGNLTPAYSGMVTTAASGNVRVKPGLIRVTGGHGTSWVRWASAGTHKVAITDRVNPSLRGWAYVNTPR